MSSRRGWQGDWEGRKSTEWMGSIRNLRKKIPAFTQNIFRIGMGINKYKDLIVREPFPDVAVDLGIGHIEYEFGYIEAATRDRIPIESVRNNYRSRLFRGRKQGYKLVGHRELLDDVLMALSTHPSLAKMADVESLEATVYLSIYGARMHIEFLVPHCKRDSYILRVTCRNSVDKKFALTINLSLYSGEPIEGQVYIPFDGFHHIHTQELWDGAISNFMRNALNNFLYGKWQTDTIDFNVDFSDIILALYQYYIVETIL